MIKTLFTLFLTFVYLLEFITLFKKVSNQLRNLCYSLDVTYVKPLPLITLAYVKFNLYRWIITAR